MDNEGERIFKGAGEGRGLWIGATVDRSSLPISVQLVVPETAHITLLHLGKERRTLEECQQLISDCRDAIPDEKSFEIKIGGLGFLFRRHGKHTPILLVDSKEICGLRQDIRYNIRLAYEDVFGFIPHITMTTALSHSDSLWRDIYSSGEYRVKVSDISIHCGEEHVVL